MTPVVSVLCLSMNHEPYVAQFFESLASQTYDSFEVIYLDNCSSDSTLKIASKLLSAQNKYTYKIVPTDTPRTLPRNLIELEKHACGEFVLVISCDDWLAPEALGLMVERMRDCPKAGLVYNRGWNYQEPQGTLSAVELSRCVEGRVFDDIFLHGVVFPPGVLIRRSVLHEVGGWDPELRVEDYDLWLRIAARHEIAVQPTPCIYYRRHAASMNRSAYRSHLRDYLSTVDKYETHPLHRVVRNEFFAHELQYTFDRGEYLESIRLIMRRPRLRRAYASILLRSTLGILKRGIA